MKPIGDKIVKLIYDMNFDTHPLIFHVFSNGGAYLYQHIWLAFRQYSPTVQVRLKLGECSCSMYLKYISSGLDVLSLDFGKFVRIERKYLRIDFQKY